MTRHPEWVTGWARFLKAGRWAAALGFLSACQALGPAPLPPPAPIAPQDPPSAESEAFSAYYTSVEDRLLRDGLLRTDGGGGDAPITATALAQNFERIALFDEYALTGGQFVAEEQPSVLRRWSDPVRIQAHFGPSSTMLARSQDRAYLASFARRLGRITGHPISTTGSGGNFHVLYLNRDEQLNAQTLLPELIPGLNPAVLQNISRLPRFEFCTVYAIHDSADPAHYGMAVALIRTEHPELLRRSCVHEEVAQGLGLPNDSPAARPSIFNDDEEFALLTRHDELLLEMLYDKRLEPGSTAEDARPMIRVIAQELTGGGPS